MFDIIIRNGILIDGTGTKRRQADVGVKGEKIRKIGDLKNERAKQIIDAKGHYVTPGFVDINNHSDSYWRIFTDPDLKSLVYQGITTIIGGSCGSSLSPIINKESIKSIRKWVDTRKFNFNWSRLDSLFLNLEKDGLAVNFGTLVGHSTIRRGIMGDKVNVVNDAEIKAMKKILKKSLREGHMGFSTGLTFSHARLASNKELMTLVKTVVRQNKVYATHLRDEMDKLSMAVEEAIKTAKMTNAKLHIFHLKALGEKNWPLIEKALQKISQAKKSGLDITFSIYPYTISGSVLYTFLPEWVARGGRRMMLNRLRKESYRQRVIAEMKKSGIDYAKMIISISSIDKTIVNKRIEVIAKTQNKSIEETVIDLLLINNGRIIVLAGMMSEENIKAKIKHPVSLIASAGVGYDEEYQNSGRIVHPRNFGAFPRVLRKYVLQEKIITWEKAITKMTSLPAEKFGVEQRGVIAKNYFADILIINPKTITDLATIKNPYRYAKGIEYSLINGKLTIKNGKYVGERNGKIIKG